MIIDNNVMFIDWCKSSKIFEKVDLSNYFIIKMTSIRKGKFDLYYVLYGDVKLKVKRITKNIFIVDDIIKKDILCKLGNIKFNKDLIIKITVPFILYPLLDKGFYHRHQDIRYMKLSEIHDFYNKIVEGYSILSKIDSCPKIISVWLQDDEYILTLMEKIPEKQFNDLTISYIKRNYKRLLNKIRLLHKYNLIHGDLLINNISDIDNLFIESEVLHNIYISNKNNFSFIDIDDCYTYNYSYKYFNITNIEYERWKMMEYNFIKKYIDNLYKDN